MTYGILRGSCRFGIHLVAEEHRSFEVPRAHDPRLIFSSSTDEEGWETRNTHKFDRYLLIVQEIGALENDTERALSNLLADSVMDTDDI